MVQGETEGKPHLRVDRKKLRTALLTIGKLGKKELPDAVFSFEGGKLSIRQGGMCLTARAEGHWPGQAVVEGHFLQKKRIFGGGGTVPVWVREGQLLFGELSAVEFAVPCKWLSGSGGSVIAVSKGASFVDILRATKGRSSDEIERSGLMKAVREAELKRQKLISKAADVLSPLGIDREDIKVFVEQYL